MRGRPTRPAPTCIIGKACRPRSSPPLPGRPHRTGNRPGPDPIRQRGALFTGQARVDPAGMIAMLAVAAVGHDQFQFLGVRHR